MYYFRKAGDTYSPNRYTFDSILFFYVVNMLLCFFVSLGFTRLVSLAVRVRWLYLFCMIVSLFFSILWYLPIRGFFFIGLFNVYSVNGREDYGFLIIPCRWPDQLHRLNKDHLKDYFKQDGHYSFHIYRILIFYRKRSID